MKFIGHYADKALCTNNRLEAIIEDPFILVINREIDTQKEMEVISKRMIDLGVYQLVVIASSFSKEVKIMGALNAQAAKSGKGFYFLMIEVGGYTTEEFE